MSDNKRKYNYSTGLIVICFIFFWPVGLLLLFLKLTEGKNLLGNKTDPQSPSQARSPIQNPFRAQSSNVVKKTENCSGCGAPNVITTGIPCICEYCGKKLN